MKNTRKIISKWFKSINLTFLGLCFCLSLSSNMYANDGALLATFPYKIKFMTKHPDSGLIYATTDNELLIINPQEKTITDIPSWGDLAGLTFSEDKTKLYVSRSSAQEILVLDTASNTLLDPIELPYMPYDLRLAADGYLYATIRGKDVFDAGYMQIDPQHQFVNRYATVWYENNFIHENSLIEISPDFKTLYFGSLDGTPGKLSVYKISENAENKEPSLSYANGALGGNGRDLHLTTNGDYLYYVVASGNYRYDIARIRTKDMSIKGRLHTDAFPTAITTSSDGKIAFTNNHSRFIQVWDTERQIKRCEFKIQDQFESLKKMTLDSSGEILLIAFTNSLALYSTNCPSEEVKSLE